MNCPSCNARLHPNVRFCGICGHKLARGPSEFAQEDDAATEIDPQQLFVPERNDGDPFAGMVLNNRFLVEQKLGEGGFGAVYKGTQTGTGRKVAIKLLHPNMTRDDNLVARFRREGLVLCNLRDAHTVTTYDFDQTADGTLYIAMELLEGRSLHDVFQDDAPLDWRRMFKILTEMCSSLAEAHAQGIVHRDLKPENILLESRPGHPDFVKILDFGIA
jgi:serine/threonine-protein kinase